MSLLDDPRIQVRVPLRLVVSVLAAAAALLVVGVLERTLRLPLLFPSFVVIVFVSAELAGTRYGVITMALFGAGYLSLYDARRAYGLDDRHLVVVLVAYATAGVAIALIGGALRRAYARLRDEHRAVTRMSAQREDVLKTLTHDVRTPLNVIAGNAALLARASEDAVILRRAQAIKKGAASVAGMLDDLVNMADVESGHLRLEREPVELASFVAELKSRLDGTLPLARVEVAVPEDLPALHVDPRRLERILVNLLSNALKYAPAPTPVVVGAAAQERYVVVSVADRGPGISEQDLPRVFEKYFRASGARKKEGSGVGLYSTRLLVQAHGGRIWIESALGKGTTFYVALPTAPAGQAVALDTPPRASDAARGGGVVRAGADAPAQRHPIAPASSHPESP